MERQQRRLAAILAADVAGYSRLMAADEGGTLARFNALRSELLDQKIAQFHGRVVGSAGDSLLVEFGSAVDAVQCAVEAQERLTARNADLPGDRRMAFRMGINLGDVIVEGDTIHGDCVNVAARLERLGEPGAVVVARSIYDQVKGKLPYAFTDLGEHSVKNIAEPVRAYRVEHAERPAAVRPVHAEDLPLPSKPSVAVLPFTNMSGDPEQEFFSDGITEDIITELSRYNSLFVVARNSSFVFRGRAADIRDIGRALGVRYVLEGSVRKGGDRIRVTAQLISAESGGHIWVDRYDGDLVNVFALQDEISRTIVTTIAGRLEDSQAERLTRRPTDDLNAYEHVLRGQKYLQKYTQEDYAKARKCFELAVSYDQNFARAHAFLAVVEVYSWFWDSSSLGLDHAVRVGET